MVDDDLLVDTKTELFELALRSGLKVFSEMLEEDRQVICGRRYAYEPARSASRAGTAPSEVVLGGRKVAIRRPRARTAESEVPLPTFQVMAQTDALDRRVVEQMLVGVATWHPPREAQRQAVADWADGATLGRRWRPQSCQRLPSLEGHKALPRLVAALRARDRQLGIAASVENVA